MDDDIVALFPVHRSGNTVFITNLESCCQSETRITSREEDSLQSITLHAGEINTRQTLTWQKAHRRISSKLRPVEAGYDMVSLIVFLGSITKTVRIYQKPILVFEFGCRKHAPEGYIR
jgi:hypothetical protein